MCLYVRDGIEQRMRRSLAKTGGKRICFKVVSVHDTSIWQTHCWRHGWNRSSRYHKRVCVYERRRRCVYKGFHVYWTRAAAREAEGRFGQLLSVECHERDMVAGGLEGTHWGAVFTKVRVLPGEVLDGRAEARR